MASCSLLVGGGLAFAGPFQALSGYCPRLHLSIRTSAIWLTQLQRRFIFHSLQGNINNSAS
jgi:hypothetical protein